MVHNGMLHWNDFQPNIVWLKIAQRDVTFKHIEHGKFSIQTAGLTLEEIAAKTSFWVDMCKTKIH